MKTLIHKNSNKDKDIYLIPRNEPIDTLDWLQISIDYATEEFLVKKLKNFYPNFSEWDINPKPAFPSGLLGGFIVKEHLEQSQENTYKTYFDEIAQKLNNYVKFICKAKQCGDLTKALLLSSPARLVKLLQEQLDLEVNTSTVFDDKLVQDFTMLAELITEQAKKEKSIRENIGETTFELIQKIQTRLNNQYAQVA
jgi:hypothetical protein